MILVGVFVLGAIAWWSHNTYLSASLFDQSGLVTTSGTPLYIADNFVARAGETGEVDIRVGTGFPTDALTQFKGVTFTLDWNPEQADLLLADFTGSVLADDTNKQLTVDRNITNTNAEITITTTTPNLTLSPGDSLLQLSFALSTNNIEDSVVSLPLSNAEVAYGCDTGAGCSGLQAANLTNLGNGKITITADAAQSYTDSELIVLKNNILAEPGEEATVFVHNTAAKNIAGLLFDISFPTQYLEFLSASYDHTIFANRSDVALQTDTKQSGHVGVIGATSTLYGVNAGSDTRLIALTFRVKDSTPLGTKMPLDVHRVEWVDANLDHIVATGLDGEIKATGANKLKLVNAHMTDSTTAVLTFNHAIDQASIEAITITPDDLINDSVRYSINDTELILEDLNAAVAGRGYAIEISNLVVEPIASDTIGTVSSDHASAVMIGYPDDPVGDLAITNVIATAPNTVEVYFNKNLDADTLGTFDADIFSWQDSQKTPLFVENIKVTESKAVITTGAQTANQHYLLTLDPTVKDTDGANIGPKATATFDGYTVGQIYLTSTSPSEIEQGAIATITLQGTNFTDDMIVTVGATQIAPSNLSDDQITLSLPATFTAGNHDVRITSTETGAVALLSQGLTVVDPAVSAGLPIVLSDESYASPSKVPNDNTTMTTLWARIDDPRGVSDLDKVTADLRNINGPASQAMSFHSIVDDKAWYTLDITVPSTVATQAEPVKIPLTAQNKSGNKGFGEVRVIISNDLSSSLAPEIIQAVASPNYATPNATSIQFHVEAKDGDGGDTIRRVVVDATSIGLGSIALDTLEPVGDKRQCTYGDYEVSDWGGCSAGKQSRAVNIRDGIDCVDGAAKPVLQRNCAYRACLLNDWELDEWSTCTNGKQFRDYKLKANITCVGEDFKPARQERSCVSVTSLIDSLLPVAHAANARIGVVGQRIWFVSKTYTVPTTTKDGTYNLPVTVIDDTGEEATGSLSIVITRDGNAPVIDEDDIYLSPHREGVFNDGISEFQVFAKVTDPDGPRHD